MGREAAYSGNGLDWDAISKSTFKYGPDLMYSDASKLEFGEFRTLKPPMPSLFNIARTPPMAPVA
jgi:hypothetical protein